eukprot:TRINITY_DN6173_c0_g1_i1.p1 TRINITY_DN6173_c0_g1~~TRINITY_DN6173_c0_g1_i1.p1  ORF type:complete len:308 (+),score=63.44 TRINITY_DN6173_c0_g1_i1:79-1002(+)
MDFSRHSLLNFSLLFLLSLICMPEGLNAAYGSCRNSRKCCNGKDLNCVVNDESSLLASNQVIQDKDGEGGEYEEPCYCDHGCLELGDCCPDFKDYCGVIDCSVSDWSDWGPCDVDCGSGNSIRKREILHPPSNGGDECPVLEEKRPCKARDCKVLSEDSKGGKRKFNDKMALRETAMLVPGKYKTKQERRSARNYDVRANLKTYRPRDQEAEAESSYCVVFKVDNAMHACHKSQDTAMLKKGHRICVSCDSNAQRAHLGGRCTGHGTEGRKTRFKNILAPHCRGKWTRLQIVDGKCPCRNGADLVFV